MSRAHAPLSAAAFKELHDQSLTNNWRDGITGLLLYDGLRFLQAIEGRPSVIEACYARIRSDARHHHVVEVDRDEAADHQFGLWSLRALDLSGATREFRQAVVADVSGLTNEHLRATFIGFATLAR